MSCLFCEPGEGWAASRGSSQSEKPSPAPIRPRDAPGPPPQAPFFLWRQRQNKTGPRRRPGREWTLSLEAGGGGYCRRRGGVCGGRWGGPAAPPASLGSLGGRGGRGGLGELGKRRFRRCDPRPPSRRSSSPAPPPPTAPARRRRRSCCPASQPGAQVRPRSSPKPGPPAVTALAEAPAGRARAGRPGPAPRRPRRRPRGLLGAAALPARPPPPGCTHTPPRALTLAPAAPAQAGTERTLASPRPRSA